jgi:hypothetical protein
MKTYTNYKDIPANNWYLGSENEDGSIYEGLNNLINKAKNLVRLKEDDGTYSYFDLWDIIIGTNNRYIIEFCPDIEADIPSVNEWVIWDTEKNQALHNEWFDTEKRAYDYLNNFLIEA